MMAKGPPIKVLNKYKFYITESRHVQVYKNKLSFVFEEIDISLINQTRTATIASELLRNMLTYAEKGEAILEEIVYGKHKAVRMTFIDKGPGIQDMEKAMTKGYSTGKNYGLGLPAAKRMMKYFDIKSNTKGTKITVIHW